MNADTFCLGKNFVLLKYTQKMVNVYAYNKSLKPIKGVTTMNGATAWDDLVTQHTYIQLQ